MTTDLRRLDYIDAFRGIAVIMVLLTHSVQEAHGLPTWLYNFFFSGMYGVQLFFVASAFTMLHSYSSRKSESHHGLKFFIRRFFRIAPMFYVGIIYYTLIGWLPKHSFYPVTAIVSTIFFCHGFFADYINMVVLGGWSIAVEFTFYLLVPFFSKILTSIVPSIIFAAVCLGICYFANSLALSAGHDLVENRYTYYWLPNQLIIFAFGFILYHWVVRTPEDHPTRIWERPLLYVSTAAIIVLAMWHPESVYSHIPIGLLFIPWCYSVARIRPKFFVNPFLRKIGDLSFSIYIWHGGLKMLLSRVPMHSSYPFQEQLWWFPFFFAVIFGISYYLSLWSRTAVEERGQNWGRQLIKKLA